MMAIHSPKLNPIYGNFSPTIIFMAIGAYLFFKNTFIKNSYWLSIRALVCRHSFGIYLIHVLILKWLSIVQIHWNFTHPATAIPITVLLTLILSTLFVIVVSRIPYGKYISG
jgi:surface polysaccharide O-acyltransferase-like enzyme